MGLLHILQFPNPRLRLKAVPVEKVTPEIQEMLDNMLETMYESHGIGLAATQVDIQQRLVVIDVSREKNTPQYFVNPEIIESEGTETMEEACLSVPGVSGLVTRPEKITATYLDYHGMPQRLETDGLLAVCLQHEIDHLNGKLYIDHLSPLKRQRLEKKLEKQEQHQL